MALHKGVQIDDGLAGLIGHMPRVEEYRENLQTLQAVWDSLALLGHLSGTGADMGETRAAFHTLTGQLLNQLGRETLKKSVLEMQSKAQVAIDIIVRNLFERTADIGFLAMDGEVRKHLRLAASKAAPEEVAQSAQLLRERFGEYVRKYSVYFDVILLDAQGRVLVQLDEAGTLETSRDPLVAASLASNAPYVETFRRSDLLPGDAPGLIYSSRVTEAQGGAPLGVLCLCFRFEDEARKIFTKLAGAEDWSVITLLDGEGKVIASSDPHHIPVGAALPRVMDTQWKVLRFAGRQYLAATRATQGYQGYQGPGWCGHVMLPLAHAFDEQARQADGQAGQQTEAGAALPAEVLEAVTGNARLFGEQLRDIPVQARRIQRALNRSVWNGSVRQNDAAQESSGNASFSKVLLWEISNTGFKTQDVFERSIGNLHQTVVSSLLQDSGFRAALAIVIMDRNLYERANDCRWWALAPEFRQVLAGGCADEEQLKSASETLAQINGLYTVYDNLVLFDRQGRVAAVSNPRYAHCVGEAPQAEWVGRALALAGSQGYAVSSFEATPLYDGRHTYIYAAAVFHPQNEREAVGGIGIVFDSAPQFAAMLEDALPRGADGRVTAGCFGVFTDRARCVIASSRAGISPGDTLALDETLFRAANGNGVSRVVEFEGAYYAVGVSVSSGYREYKGEGDAYRNDVVALVFFPLGERHAETRCAAPSRHGRGHTRKLNGSESSGHIEIATFYVGSHWVGIPAQHVVEAIDFKDMARAPATGEERVNYLMFRGQPVPVLGLHNALGDPGEGAREQQIVILELTPELRLGVMVDELGDIQSIPHAQVEQVTGVLGEKNCLTEGLVKPDEAQGREGMIMLLSPDRMRQRFFPALH